MSKILIVSSLFLLLFSFTKSMAKCVIMQFFQLLFSLFYCCYNIQMYIVYIHRFYRIKFYEIFSQCHNKGKSSSYDIHSAYFPNKRTHKRSWRKLNSRSIARVFVCTHFNKSFNASYSTKQLW